VQAMSGPFEVRWGPHATSEKMPNAPPSQMIQVNKSTGNTRVVRREDGSVSIPMATPMPSGQSSRHCEECMTHCAAGGMGALQGLVAVLKDPVFQKRAGMAIVVGFFFFGLYTAIKAIGVSKVAGLTVYLTSATLLLPFSHNLPMRDSIVPAFAMMWVQMGPASFHWRMQWINNLMISALKTLAVYYQAKPFLLLSVAQTALMTVFLLPHSVNVYTPFSAVFTIDFIALLVFTFSL